MVVGVYFNASAVGSKGGDGGSGINGNLICNGNNNITITAGFGNRLSLEGYNSTVGKAGSGVTGNVIVKNSTQLTISGGGKWTASNVDGYGIGGYLKAYGDSVVTVSGGEGQVGSLNKGDGGTGVNGDVSLYDNSILVCTGGKGGDASTGKYGGRIRKWW